MEVADFIKHAKECLVWNDLHDELTHLRFETLADSIARLLKHAYEAGARNQDAEGYYAEQRPAGPIVGDNVR